MVEPSVDVSSLSETRVARLTAVGRSAVATVGVFGPSATEQVGQYFRPASGRRLEEIDCGKIIFGRWVSASGPGEELVVCRQRPDHVEVHCHGGDAAVQKIQDALDVQPILLHSARAEVDRVFGDTRRLYRARLLDITEQSARDACRRLIRDQFVCIPIPPEGEFLAIAKN